MQQAFYPVLFSILVLASLGLPIPEDIPLIAAGVLLRTSPGIATWAGTLAVALVGVMLGDLVLYAIGRWWGRDVVRHRSVNWLITPARFERACARFHRYGVWFCFFGRFIVGVRAAMCLTAGATHFPYWRFFLADFIGAAASVPLFLYLGYWFAGMLPTLERYLAEAQWTLLAVGLVVIGVLFFAYRYRRAQRHKALTAARAEQHAGRTSGAAPAVSSTPKPAGAPASAPEFGQRRIPADAGHQSKK